MRLTYSSKQMVAQESITGRLLMDMGLNNPDMLPTIFSSLPQSAARTPRLISILEAKGLKTKGLAQYGMTPDMEIAKKYRPVTSNHVQYRIAGDDCRKEYFRANIDGVTFIDDANPTQPGKNKQGFYIFLDSNWVGGNEVIMLADNKTQLWVCTDEGGIEQPGGVFRYYVKVWGNNTDEYVDTYYLQDGDEAVQMYNAHQQDFSKHGNEKYKFNDQWGDAYLTLMRFKYSYSGTAQAMDKQKKVEGYWVTANGDIKNQSFISYADVKMMEEVGKSLDYLMLEGKQTVSQDTKKVVITNDKGNEVLAGSGLLYSNDGPIEYPQANGWSKKFMNNLLSDIDTHITMSSDGTKEVAVILPSRSYNDFCITMSEMNVTQNENIVGEGGEKIVVNTYKGYELGGIRMYVTRDESLDKAPGKKLADGTSTADHRGIIVPLGKTTGGSNGVEMLQLRPMVRGRVAGINEGGDVSSSIDGTSVHALTQTGIVSQIQPIILYKPVQR